MKRCFVGSASLLLVDVLVQQRVEVERVKNVPAQQEVTGEPRLRLAFAVGATPAFGQPFQGHAHRVAPLGQPLIGGAGAVAGQMEAVSRRKGAGLAHLRLLRQADGGGEGGAELLREHALFVQWHFDHLQLTFNC